MDIITIGDLRSESEDLTLPHPRAAERAFVLLPWAQADPSAQLDGRLVSELADDADDRRGVRWLALDWATSDKLPALPTGQYVTGSNKPSEEPAAQDSADSSEELPAVGGENPEDAEPPLETGAMEQVEELPELEPEAVAEAPVEEAEETPEAAAPVEETAEPAEEAAPAPEETPAPAPPSFGIPAAADEWAAPPAWDDVVSGDSHKGTQS